MKAVYLSTAASSSEKWKLWSRSVACQVDVKLNLTKSLSLSLSSICFQPVLFLHPQHSQEHWPAVRGHMMPFKVNLIGPSPWGFRISGGRDFKKAITVSKVILHPINQSSCPEHATCFFICEWSHRGTSLGISLFVWYFKQ